jgi:multiple antibiotic resistance protein
VNWAPDWFGGVFGNALAAFLLAFPALFSIVNPLAGAIIFNEVTAAQTHAERVALARRVAIYSTFVMLGALWTGGYVLSFFGVSLDALRIAGGLVVSVRAFEMLSAPENRTDRKTAETAEVARGAGELGAYAFFPLTLPFTTGPGTISVAISLGSERPDHVAPGLVFFAGASAAVLAMAVLVWVFYTTADRFARVLGNTGRQVVARLAAFLLAGIGVQIVISGAVPLLRAAMH